MWTISEFINTYRVYEVEQCGFTCGQVLWNPLSSTYFHEHFTTVFALDSPSASSCWSMASASRCFITARSSVGVSRPRRMVSYETVTPWKAHAFSITDGLYGRSCAHLCAAFSGTAPSTRAPWHCDRTADNQWAWLWGLLPVSWLTPSVWSPRWRRRTSPRPSAILPCP